jgi:hypothetical protein
MLAETPDAADHHGVRHGKFGDGATELTIHPSVRSRDLCHRGDRRNR